MQKLEEPKREIGCVTKLTNDNNGRMFNVYNYILAGFVKDFIGWRLMYEKYKSRTNSLPAPFSL